MELVDFLPGTTIDDSEKNFAIKILENKIKLAKGGVFQSYYFETVEALLARTSIAKPREKELYSKKLKDVENFQFLFLRENLFEALKEAKVEVSDFKQANSDFYESQIDTLFLEGELYLADANLSELAGYIESNYAELNENKDILMSEQESLASSIKELL